MTPEQIRSFDILLEQIQQGKVLPSLLGDWAFANGVWTEALERYNNLIFADLLRNIL